MSSPLNIEWDEEDVFPNNKGKDAPATDPFMVRNEIPFARDEALLRSDLLVDSTPEEGSITDSQAEVAAITGVGIESAGADDSSIRKSATKSPCASSSSGPSRRKKKPKGMPKRPLSAYNLFFQSQRVKILDENGAAGNRKIGFEELGRVIGKKWKSLSSGERKIYVKLAEKDNIRYRKEMDAYNEMKTKRLEEADKLAPIDLQDTPSTGYAGPRGPEHEVSSNTFHSQQRPPKFLQVESGFVSSAPGQPTSNPNPPFLNEFSRQPLQSVPGIAQSIPGSYPAEMHQAQFSQGYFLDNNLTRTPSAASSIQAAGSQNTIMTQPTPVASHNSFPIPPGMELTLSQGGADRKYRVQYTCFSMSRDAAQQYIESLTPGAQNQGRPPQNAQNGSWGV